MAVGVGRGEILSHAKKAGEPECIARPVLRGGLDLLVLNLEDDFGGEVHVAAVALANERLQPVGEGGELLVGIPRRESADLPEPVEIVFQSHR